MPQAALEELGKLDWTFRGIRAKEGIHGIHTYPAMMAPPVARRLVSELSNEGETVLDPFCGSGTVLAEAILLNREAIGYDINPLALLIAKVKTTPLSPGKLETALGNIELRVLSQGYPDNVPDFFNIEYWFKPEVITELSKLKRAIEGEGDESIRDFFKVVFAATVRQASNTRGSEFKLYRLPPEKLESHKPDVFGVFRAIAIKSISIMEEFHAAMRGIQPEVDIRLHDSTLPLPLAPSIPLMLTSPPYGDSRTTVAYGQFSRLALQWLDMWEKDVDRESLGGKRVHLSREIASLKGSLAKIREADDRRAQDVEAFYHDLYLCLENISKTIEPSGFAVFIVANRKVKGVILPTDEIVAEMMAYMGYEHLDTFHREIPNKRMPSKNSPSNISGEKETTMLREHIVLLRRL